MDVTRLPGTARRGRRRWGWTVFDNNVTVAGNACEKPEKKIAASGVVFTKFRLASNLRRRNIETGLYEDGHVNYYSVVAFGRCAENIVSSTDKGHPLLVFGKLRIHDYNREDGSRGTSVEIEATHIGHDFSLGATAWIRGGRQVVDPRDRMTDPALNAQRIADDAAGAGSGGTGRRDNGPQRSRNDGHSWGDWSDPDPSDSAPDESSASDTGSFGTGENPTMPYPNHNATAIDSPGEEGPVEESVVDEREADAVPA
jgi:single-stranded DNA-binding protein